MSKNFPNLFFSIFSKFNFSFFSKFLFSNNHLRSKETAYIANLYILLVLNLNGFTFLAQTMPNAHPLNYPHMGYWVQIYKIVCNWNVSEKHNTHKQYDRIEPISISCCHFVSAMSTRSDLFMWKYISTV